MPGLYLFNELHFLRLPSFAERILYKYEHGSAVKLIQWYEYSFSMTVYDLLDRISLDPENAIIEKCLEMLNRPLCVALAKVIRN